MATLEDVLGEIRAAFEADGGGLPVGTQRQWKSGTVIKTKQGWQPVAGGGAAPKTPEAPAPKGFSSAHKFWSGFKAPKPGHPPAPGTLATPQPGKHWKTKKKPHKPRSSADKHRGPDGRYTPERRKLHREILTSFLQHVPSVPEGQKPAAVMMMGGPASGKGAISSVLPDNTFVKVDADRLKEMLPEYQEMVDKGDRDAASYAHEESGYLASKLRDIARQERKNMVLDGTGKYSSSYAHRMKQLQRDGYHVQLMMPDLDVETAVERAKKRGEQTGRWVPEKVVRQNYAVIPGNFLQLAKLADAAMLYDNRGDFPKLVWSNTASGEQTVDDDFMTAFREKHGPKPRRRFDHFVRVRNDLRSLLGEDEHAVAIDPMAIAKEAEKLKDAPKLSGEPKFSEDEGLILPEPDDSALADVSDE